MVAQSSDRIPVEERISALSRPLRAPSSLHYKGHRVYFSGVKQQAAGVWC